MIKYLFIILISIVTLQATGNYRLMIDELSYQEVNSEMKLLFTLNNSYTFLGDLDEELIEKFIPGTSVILESDPYGYFLSKRTFCGPIFYLTDSYPIALSNETLETLPTIVSMEKVTDFIYYTYLVELDDGSLWCSRETYFPKILEVYPDWSVGDRVMISYTGYGLYNIINVDTPHQIHRQASFLNLKAD